MTLRNMTAVIVIKPWPGMEACHAWVEGHLATGKYVSSQSQTRILLRGSQTPPHNKFSGECAQTEIPQHGDGNMTQEIYMAIPLN